MPSWTRRSRYTGQPWRPRGWSSHGGRGGGDGTGTPVVTRSRQEPGTGVWRHRQSLCARTAKSNLGHTESREAAGLIKAILSLRHGVAPPMVQFTGLPDDLVSDRPFCAAADHAVVQQRTGPRQMAASAYGMSGTNVHAILEQAPHKLRPSARMRTKTFQLGRYGGPAVVRVSSTSAMGCGRPRGGSSWVEDRADSVVLSDLAYTLAGGVRTGRCAPRWWPPACRNCSKVCGRWPMVTSRIRLRWDRASGTGVGFRARVAVGRDGR